jgi:hypothetical protein
VGPNHFHPPIGREAARWQQLSVIELQRCSWKDPLNSLDSLAEVGTRTAHQAEARMLVQSSRELHVMMTGEHWLQKHSKGGTPT